ncbi:hypothetical protein NDU88_002060 [Pleurodeles waltl]|uniref:Secreted protein n=1 Tax=Pleurodeles waltl TaxID=8319 RepID=A0AAV7U9E3_PLEWA|nr:hypothetical protein NDU88_002060 [Pleurodeles waltl]
MRRRVLKRRAGRAAVLSSACAWIERAVRRGQRPAFASCCGTLLDQREGEEGGLPPPSIGGNVGEAHGRLGVARTCHPLGEAEITPEVSA